MSDLKPFSEDTNYEINNNTDVPKSFTSDREFGTKYSESDNNLEKEEPKKESFSPMNPNNLSRQTKQVINSNKYSNQQQILDNLRKEYDKTLQEYQKLMKRISQNTTGYVDRVSSKNPYLNKTIMFSTGHVCYVTKQGVVKYIPSPGVWNSVKAPKNVMKLNIPWNNSYSTPGTIIPTNPPLISGTPVKANQSLGNEGSNVFVDQLLPPIPEPTYMGCFAANKNNDNMDFIGAKPPILNEVSIQNGNFSKPEIPANSFRYIRGGTVPGWNFQNGILLNNSTAWGFPMPYPSGKQCVCLQNTAIIDTILPLQSEVTYTLTLMACGRNCCGGTTTSNPINIQLSTNLNVFISQIANLTPRINSWNLYTYTFTVPTSQSYRLFFRGTNTSGDRSTALASISLQSNAIPKGTYNYQTCRQAAITKGYRYFGLQNISTSSKLGYCAVSNSEPAIIKHGKSEVVSKMVPLWSSKTGGNPGNVAILTDTGSLQVLNSSGKAVYSTPVSKSITSKNKKISCFLIIEGDGNMGIYEGTNPNNRQSQIWSTMTSGKQEKSNPDVVASKGKYGQNWMSNGSTLAPGDFIGSTDGKLALMMQTDGNLILYTYQTDTNCQKVGNIFGGGKGANAVYDIGMSAISNNMGALGFIDGDSNLYTYPTNNQTYTTNYNKIENINAVGNDIPGKAFANSSIESCKKACDSNPDCVGFVTTRDGSTCWPKNKGMYPFGGVGEIFSGRDTYIKGKQPLRPPIGVSSNTNNINSVDYENYVKKGAVGSKYGLPNINSTEKQQLDQLRSKMSMLSKQITDLTKKFQTGSINAEQQSNENISGVNHYFKDFNNTNNKINRIAGETNGGIENILKDSDIVVLKKNYDYLFWSILAVGTVLVSMNVVKKE